MSQFIFKKKQETADDNRGAEADNTTPPLNMANVIKQFQLSDTEDRRKAGFPDGRCDRGSDS